MSVTTTYNGDSTIRPAGRALSVRRNFSWTFAGQMVFSACNWAMLIVIAKLGSPGMVGQYALGVAATQPVFLLTGLSLRNVQVQDVRGEWRPGHFAALRLLSVSLSLIAIFFLANSLGSSRETAWVIFLTGLGVALDAISELTYAVFTTQSRMDRMAVSLAVRGVLSLALLAAGVYFTGSVAWGVAGSVLASLLTLLAYDLPAGAALAGWRTFVPHFDWRAIGGIVRFAIPLGLILCLGSLGTHVPRYFIERMLGEKELGIFAAMALIINAGRTAVLSLAYSTARPLATAWAHGNRRGFVRVLAKMSAVCAVVGFVPAVAAEMGGGRLLALVYKPEYATHGDIFALVLFTGALLYMTVCQGCAMTAAKINSVQLWWMAAATGTVAALDAIMIPHWGLRGAAFASLIGALLQVISGTVILARMLSGARSSQTLAPEEQE